MKSLLKSVYEVLPAKKYIFMLIRHLWRLPKSIYQHLHFKGWITVPCESTSFQIYHLGFQLENGLFWEGLDGWEKESMALWTKLCKQHQNIFDIGANTGLYALVAKTINPQAEVFCFEPVKRIFERLRINIDRNHFDISCYEIGLSNYDGVGIIYDLPFEHVYSVSVNSNIAPEGVTSIPTEIKVRTLFSLFQSENIDGIDLVKMDVERHEVEVLEGMGDLINIYKPTFLIEVLESEIGQRIENIVSGRGYLYFNIDEETGVELTESICTSKSFNYLLCSVDIAARLELI